MKRKKKPKLAVWKFASCDGCQLSLLDCEDELLSVAQELEIANFPEASRAVVKGPYDLSLVEGSITTPHDEQRIHQVRRASKFLVTIGACATAGGIQALRNFKDVKEFISIVYAHPAVHRNPEQIHADRGPCARRFRAARLPHQQGSTPRGDSRVSSREEAQHARPQRMRGMQEARHGLRDGGPWHALPRSRSPKTVAARFVRRIDRGCYGCFGPKETPNTDSLSARFGQMGKTNQDIVRVLRNFNAWADPFRRESEAHERKVPKD